MCLAPGTEAVKYSSKSLDGAVKVSVEEDVRKGTSIIILVKKVVAFSYTF